MQGLTTRNVAFCQGWKPWQNAKKVLANGRLPGVLPGAESSANLLIANDPAKALAPGEFAGFCRLCQHHISHFQTMPGTFNPWQNAYEFKKKNVFKLFRKSKY